MLHLLSSWRVLVVVVGAVLAEQHDEWIEGRRYLGLDVLARARMTLIAGTNTTSPIEEAAITA